MVGAEARSLDRLADRANERSEHCEHCGARVRVVLRSAADVRRRRRMHRLLWPVRALLAVLSAWGLVQVVLGYSTLRSLVLTQGFDTPAVNRTDDREPYGVQHGWAAPRPVDSHDRTP
ncbi:hypothetical protein [Streptomyces longwoodensis]|uniref:hypothetical protein n=1 Tax=Streptomyces longwoodensis TaxID=68231 RepID=UPI0033C93924